MSCSRDRPDLYSLPSISGVVEEIRNDHENDDMGEHTFRAFDTDIEGLRRSVTEMGALAERQFRRAVSAIGTADPGVVAQVLADERVINALQVRIDLSCNTFIALRQPAAIDLREVIGVIHTINDLERIGDEAKKIALRARNVDASTCAEQIERVRDMATRAADMVGRAIDAFVRHDTRVAIELGACDDAVDDLRDELVAELSARMSRPSASVAQMLDLVMIVQSIERIADHAENVAEYIVNVVEGVDMRHGNIPA
jgi:phosphate transport system protein